MARIYKRTDRIAVKIDSLTVKLAPLTLDQKTEIQQAMILGRTKADIKEASRGIALSLKYAVKGIEGLEDSDGNVYKLEFDKDLNLKDSCIDDLMNLELTPKLAMVCAAMVNGVPKSFSDNEGNALEGVEVVTSQPAETAEKNA
jgi:hypothetical protein